MRQIAAIVCLITTFSPVFAQSRAERVARLIKEMDSPDAKTRAAAAEEVGKMAAVRASDAKPAVEPLLKLLADKEASVRAAAAESLGKVDEPKRAVEPLTKLLLNDPNDNVKAAAAVGLGLMGPAAKESAKALRETARKAQADMKMRLAQACRRALDSINERSK
jgi:HEAT repeat protein